MDDEEDGDKALVALESFMLGKVATWEIVRSRLLFCFLTGRASVL